MKPYIHDDFLLNTDAARELYHGHAEKMPIIDYHCHLPPAEIAGDARWSNIAEVWLGGDHYKWRQMRSNGVAERCCTGDAPWREKFDAFAATMERMVGNPLFDWSHLELARYFGVTDILNSRTADAIWNACNAKLSEPDFSARGLIRKSNVRVICTTDDPVDSLEHHLAIAAGPFGTQVRPAWRSDKASKVQDNAAWNAWIDRLASAAGMSVATWSDFLDAMAVRHEFFAKAGCVVSDYGVSKVEFVPCTDEDISRIFRSMRAGTAPSAIDAAKFQGAWLYEGLKADAAAGWTAQIHYNCMRNVNGIAFRTLGPDTGFDCIGDWSSGEALAALFDKLERTDSLPRLVLYSLNPGDMEMLGALIGSFQKAPSRGKLQLGAAWWFLDQKKGMRAQLDALAALGCLGNFVGMLTDSRSFLSYTRHEYFRRLLCQKLGDEIERGELPNDIGWLGRIVEDISFNNANGYFGFKA